MEKYKGRSRVEDTSARELNSPSTYEREHACYLMDIGQDKQHARKVTKLRRAPRAHQASYPALRPQCRGEVIDGSQTCFLAHRDLVFLSTVTMPSFDKLGSLRGKECKWSKSHTHGTWVPVRNLLGRNAGRRKTGEPLETAIGAKQMLKVFAL